MPPPCRVAMVALLLLTATPRAQQQRPQVLRSGVTAVPVFASVTNREGEPVQGLEREAFQVFDDGRPVDIALFARGTESIAIKVLLDDRKRMDAHDARARVSAESIIGGLRLQDRAGIATFHRSGSPFTGDPDHLLAALSMTLSSPRKPNSDDSVAWRNGMFEAIARFDNTGPPLYSLWTIPKAAESAQVAAASIRAIVVLSSGMDYIAPGFQPQYWVKKDEVIERIVREGYVVVGVGFEGISDDKDLKALADKSGGWFLHPRRDTDLPAEMAKILRNLQHRYLLAFVPAANDGRDHRIEVRVKRPDVVVRARSSYQAPPPSGGY